MPRLHRPRGERITIAPGGCPFDDSAEAARAFDRALDLAIALFAVGAAALVLLTLRVWLRSGRWTLPFICDVGILILALLLVSPAGPTVGGLTTVYLVILACAATFAALAIVRDRPWNTSSGE